VSGLADHSASGCRVHGSEHENVGIKTESNPLHIYFSSIFLYFSEIVLYSTISQSSSSTPPRTLTMAARAILRKQRPAAVTAGLVGATGIGLWVARSYLTNSAFAESPEPPTVFSSWFGQSLRLGSSEVVNHNTKRLQFEFPDEDSRSGLILTCKLLTQLAVCNQSLG
jgi:hypothetical protein